MSMQPSATSHPTAEELMAYGDGESAAEVAAHLEGCSTCADQAQSYMNLLGGLRHSLYRFDCPDPHTLGEYQLGLLEPEQDRGVAAHAAECDACSAELQTLRSYLAMPAPVTDSLVERARRMVATLFRPAPGLAYGGLRGTSEATTQVFQVEDVSLTVGAGQGRGTLVGLVLIAGTDPRALEGRTVRLVPADHGALDSRLDDLGNFEFDQVPAGLYALEIELPDAMVVVEELRID
jgi:hypothetical protein